ncbi:RHS repeat-associated core domain-containing protein [Streptomyces sp. 2A115]|uniref:RHS repeat-associated core domain-containing protein n=1 Tax=Streptomyces sp. 2A115 TaxID=3457439 RepID=UPI003FCF5434
MPASPSNELAVDATTGAATRRRYTPFGDERAGALPTGTDNGFLGKVEDTSTGLSLLGARAYDPNLGRFLSPDPLSTPYNPQNLSAYSYSSNDPVNYSDPSGLLEMCTYGPCKIDTDGNGEVDTVDLPGTTTGGSGGTAQAGSTSHTGGTGNSGDVTQPKILPVWYGTSNPNSTWEIVESLVLPDFGDWEGACSVRQARRASRSAPRVVE